MHGTIAEFLYDAVHDRIINSDRPVGFLLSGGLDSSIVCAMGAVLSRPEPVCTFSVGLKDSLDLCFARQVAEHIGSVHSELIVTENDLIQAIPSVIAALGTDDTTTVRASLGNYLLGKHIRETTDIKVVLNGDGSDELFGGYKYMYACPNCFEFDKEVRRLLDNIHLFDVRRSDACMAAHGLEARTPFLDKRLVQYVLQIPAEFRDHNRRNRREKYLLRKSIEIGRAHV